MGSSLDIAHFEVMSGGLILPESNMELKRPWRSNIEIGYKTRGYGGTPIMVPASPIDFDDGGDME